MISSDWARMMARYNAWQNGLVYACADGLDAGARQAERGAFFGSIEKTLNHLLWADRMWMSRFDGTPKPKAGSIAASVEEEPDWSTLTAARNETDRMIADWAAGLDDETLRGDLTWFSGASGRELTRPLAGLVVHFFNHQTHHRGQVNAMLTAAGGHPGDTDLFLMPD